MLLERFIAVFLLGLFLLLAGTCSARLLRIPLAQQPPFHLGGWVRVLVDRAVLGSGLLVTVLVVLAAVGGYRSWLLSTLVIAIVVVGSLLLRAEMQGLRALEAEPARVALPSWILRLCLLLFTGVLLVMWLHSTRPDIAWDSAVYHLTLPKLMLEHGGFTLVPLNVYSHWPHAVELLFGLCMAVHDYVLAKQLHFVFGLLTLLCFVVAARSEDHDLKPAFSDAWTALLASALFLANPIVIYEIRVAYVDVALAFFCVAAFLASERLLTRSDPVHARADLLTLGTACGLICATKLSGVFLAGCILVVFCSVIARRHGPATLGRATPLIFGPVLILAAPWPIKAWIQTGNPAYPLFFDLFGGVDWSAELGRQHAEWQARIGKGRTLTDFLKLPWRVITSGGVGYSNFDGKIHLAWLAVVPLSLWSARRNEMVRRAVIVILLYFVVWAVTSQQMRFLIPLLALGSVAGAQALRDLCTELDSSSAEPRFGARLVPAAAALLVAMSIWAAWIYISQSPRMAKDLARFGYQAKQVVTHPVYGAIDELPENAKLLLLNTNHTFHVNRPAIADSFFEASQIIDMFGALDSAQQAADLMRERELTHVLVEQRQPGMRYPAPLVDLLNDGSQAHVVYRSEDNRFVLLELAWTAKG